jgi:S-adenosylmethionine synthetase
VPLANDSSAGAGFAPFSPLERLVAGCERALNAPGTRPHPGCGEDVKVCATRVGAATRLAIACAGVAPLLDGPASYRDAMDAAARVARDLAAGEAALSLEEVRVNAADEPRDGSFYLTVTGTSAEAGDDGATGRGNRASGLVAPGRRATRASSTRSPRRSWRRRSPRRSVALPRRSACSQAGSARRSTRPRSSTCASRCAVAPRSAT